MAIASSVRGLKLQKVTPKDQNKFINKVSLTFYEILRRKKVSAIGAYSTIAEVKHLQQVDIDRLQHREDPTISQILFQKIGAGQETMILCTAYGLLIYECTFVPLKTESSE